MPTQQFLSPGVVIDEVDQSAVQQAAPGVGALVVGRTQAGPAMVPTLVRNFEEYRVQFGDLDPSYAVSYAAKNYLASADGLTVVRVLGHADGTTANNGYTVGGITGISDVSGANGATGSILAVIHHSGTSAVVNVAGVVGDANNFVFSLTAGATTTFATTASFVTSSANYISKVLNTDPTKYSTYGHYLAAVYKYQQPAASASWWKAGIVSASFVSFTRDFSFGSTSWIKSQPLGGNEYDMFRVHTLAHGRATNDAIKVTVANVKQSPAPTVTPFGTFDVLVRSFYDTDLRPVVLESFTQLTMDPSSPNYLPRRIGDTVETFDTTTRKFIANGSFPSKSRRIRVELATTTIPLESVPWGFRGYPKASFSGSAGVGQGNLAGFNGVPALPYTVTQRDANGNFNAAIAWGVLFVSGGVADRMRGVPDALVDGQAQAYLTGSDADFSLRFLSGTYDSSGQLRYGYNAAAGTYAPIYCSASIQRFSLPFFGAVDGFDVRTADPLYLSNSATETNVGVVSLKRALDCVANPAVVDFNMLVIPGVHNLKVCDYGRQLVNDRRDAIYVMDVTGSSTGEAIDALKNREVDDNYVAAYYPDVKVDDRVNLRVVRIPPSAVVIGAYAYSDKIGQVWFAPAGLNRGGLGQFGVIDTVDRLNHQDRNDLYEARINPIATFPGEGVSIQGQKTLQVAASALDRVNVRRLLIYAKRAVASAAKRLLFEPNDPNTWQRFTNTVNPILERVARDRGVARFKVVMDSNTTTPEAIDRNRMVGKIFLQPVRSAEFIEVPFIVTSTGVQFAG